MNFITYDTVDAGIIVCENSAVFRMACRSSDGIIGNAMVKTVTIGIYSASIRIRQMIVVDDTPFSVIHPCS